MSEFTATIDAHFDDPAQQKELLRLLEQQKYIKIDEQQFTVQNVQTDDILNFTLWAGGHEQEKQVSEWLMSFSPKLAVIEFFSDESQKRLGFEDGKKKSLAAVNKQFASLSKNFETGLVFQGGIRKAIKFLQENDVDITDTFQGRSHIDRIFSKYDPDHDTKIFSLLIEQGKITTELEISEERVMPIWCMNNDLVIEVLKKGGNPHVIDDYDGNNLISDFFFYSDNKTTQQLKTFLSFGIDVNHKNHDGKQAIHQFFKRLQDEAHDVEEPHMLNQLKLLIEHGASPDFIDEHGLGCMFYAQDFPKIQAYLLENFQGLKTIEEYENYSQLLLKYIGLSSKQDNDSKQLHAYFAYDLHKLLPAKDFCQLFLNTQFLKTKVNLLHRITKYLEEAVISDNLDLFNLLRDLGVPDNCIFTYPGYYTIPPHGDLLKIDDAPNIKHYLEEQNMLHTLTTSFKSKLKWSKQYLGELHDVDELSKYCSPVWKEQQINWYLEQGKTNPIGQNLSYQMAFDIRGASRAWGDDLWLKSNSAMIKNSDDSYTIMTLEEAFELPQFEFLNLLMR